MMFPSLAAPHPGPLSAHGERERGGELPLAPPAGRGRDPSRSDGRVRGSWPHICYRFMLAFVALLCLALPAHAVRPDEMLPDPTLEARARDIGKELRCLVCRNQSIDDSDADLAHDLRVLVRQRLTAGDSNSQVIDYIVSRYGDYVLLKPPFEVATWLLWGGPGLILLVGLWGIGRYMRRQAGLTGPPPLSAEEERRLAAMLEQKAEPSGTKT
jgi:cytochrome c-type biogenesis protein CcmH